MSHNCNIFAKPQQALVGNQLPLFETANSYVYTNPVKNLEDSLSKTSRLYLPIETDTEFWHHTLDITNPDRAISECLTIQHRAITTEQGLIFTHPDSRAIARHPLITTGFTPIDYLQAIGIPATIERSEYALNLPVLQFDLYGFFLTAELYRIVIGDFQ